MQRKFTLNQCIKIQLSCGSIRTVEVLKTMCNITYVGWTQNGQYCKKWYRNPELKAILVSNTKVA